MGRDPKVGRWEHSHWSHVLLKSFFFYFKATQIAFQFQRNFILLSLGSILKQINKSILPARR
jgi:hypothetical protein